jgi:NADH-quinone oxidoreductase subunit J
LVAQNIAFGIIAAGVIAAGILMVTTRNVVHAALYLIGVLAGVGATFLLVGAEFVGITQVLVYIGAIVVLFLFGIMLTRAPLGKTADLTGPHWVGGLVVAVGVLAVLAVVLVDEFEDDELPRQSLQRTAEVSDSIFRDYLVPFEVASVLLLAALVGAIVLARRD